MGDLFDTIGMIFERSGFKAFLADGGWKTLIMFVIVGVLVYLAIVKKFEPLLLLPIAFGMLLTNLPLAGIMDEPIYEIISNPTYHGKAGIPIYNGDMLVGYQYIKRTAVCFTTSIRRQAGHFPACSSSWVSAR